MNLRARYVHFLTSRHRRHFRRQKVRHRRRQTNLHAKVSLQRVFPR